MSIPDVPRTPPRPGTVLAAAALARSAVAARYAKTSELDGAIAGVCPPAMGLGAWSRQRQTPSARADDNPFRLHLPTMNLDTIAGLGSLVSAVIFAVAYVPVKHALVAFTGYGAAPVAVLLVTLIVVQAVGGFRLLKRGR